MYEIGGEPVLADNELFKIPVLQLPNPCKYNSRKRCKGFSYGKGFTERG